MQDKKKTKPAILIKEGKQIFNEVDFRSAFGENLRKYPVRLKRPLSDVFLESLNGQSLFGGVFIEFFKKMKGNPYTKDHLHYPWTHAGTYKVLHNLFLHHPVFIEPFVNSFRQYFYHPVITIWRETQTISYFKKSSDYCARALPGTKTPARETAKVCT